LSIRRRPFFDPGISLLSQSSVRVDGIKLMKVVALEDLRCGACWTTGSRRTGEGNDRGERGGGIRSLWHGIMQPGRDGWLLRADFINAAISGARDGEPPWSTKPDASS
jgi:hypothetical protein